MDNIDRLGRAVKNIYKAAYEAQNPTDVGAKLGTLSGTDSVIIDGKTYSCTSTSSAVLTSGRQVWCQLTSSYHAVIIG